MIMLVRFTKRYAVLKVDIPASVALDQGKMPLYNCTKYPICHLYHGVISVLHPERGFQEMRDVDQYLLEFQLYISRLL